MWRRCTDHCGTVASIARVECAARVFWRRLSYHAFHCAVGIHYVIVLREGRY